MVDFFVKFKQKISSYPIFNITSKRKKKKNKEEENIIFSSSTFPKKTPVITIKDIQECNRRQFGYSTNNGIVEIISYSNRSQADFCINNNKNNQDPNRFSFQTSSIYLNENRPQQEKENLIKTEPNKFWHTVNNLLRETENIYNEICLTSRLETDPFDNFSIQLENTIWEDDKTTISSYSYFNHTIFQEINTKIMGGNNQSYNYAYEYLNEILDLYIQEDAVERNKKLLNVELPSYQISSGSTLVLNK